MKKINKCPVCNNTKFRFLFKTRDFMLNRTEQFKMFECCSCGLLLLNPQLSSEELAEYYPKKYYSFGVEKIAFNNIKVSLYKIFFGKRNIFLKILFSPLKRSFRTIKIVSKGRLLDIGCGSGNFLKIVKQLNMECFGVEPGDFDKEYSKKEGFKIFHGELKDAKYPNDYFDCITLNHVFEHISNPEETLIELNRIVKKDGIIRIAIPQKNNLAYFLFKGYWVQLDSPRHLYTYSTKNIVTFVEKCGFEVKKTRYVSSPFSITGSLVNFAKDKNSPFLERVFNNKFVFLALFPVSFLCNVFNIGDTLEIVLTKKTILNKNSGKNE